MTQPRTVTTYIDYKSPYAYLAKDLVYELEREFPVRVDWLPYVLDIPSFLGSARVDDSGRVIEEERNAHQWRRVRYSSWTAVGVIISQLSQMTTNTRQFIVRTLASLHVEPRGSRRRSPSSAALQSDDELHAVAQASEFKRVLGVSLVAGDANDQAEQFELIDRGEILKQLA
jgi:hypothetical protein